MPTGTCQDLKPWKSSCNFLWSVKKKKMYFLLNFIYLFFKSCFILFLKKHTFSKPSENLQWGREVMCLDFQLSQTVSSDHNKTLKFSHSIIPFLNPSSFFFLQSSRRINLNICVHEEMPCQIKLKTDISMLDLPQFTTNLLTEEENYGWDLLWKNREKEKCFNSCPL